MNIIHLATALHLPPHTYETASPLTVMYLFYKLDDF